MGDESPEAASTLIGAVFLSYASRDTEAAQRIYGALRGAGIEVWFEPERAAGRRCLGSPDPAPALRVPGRTSSFYFKGKQVTVADYAKAEVLSRKAIALSPQEIKVHYVL